MSSSLTRPTMKEYNGSLRVLGNLANRNPDLYNEIKAGDCDCYFTKTISLILVEDSSYDLSLWVFCPYHTGYLNAIKEIEIYEFEQRAKTDSGSDRS